MNKVNDIEVIKQMVIELKDEKYQQEKNGLAKAIVDKLEFLQEGMDDEWKYNIDVCLSKFEAGMVRYHKSALFNQVIHMLMQGTDPLSILDQLMFKIDNTSKLLEDYVKNYGKPTIIVKNEDKNGNTLQTGREE